MLADWGEFIAALAVFLLSHAIPVRPPVRPFLVRTIGLVPYLALYSLLSIAVLVWLVLAARHAPYVQILPDWDLLRWVPVVVMPLVCWLAVAGLSASNPLSFGGMGKRPFDPEAPGVLGFSRHPLPLALALWSLAHLLANGDLAHVILFGIFAGFSVMAMSMLDRRKQRQLGQDAWAAQARNTAWMRISALRVTGWQVILAVLIWGVLLMAHLPVIGVSPLP